MDGMDELVCLHLLLIQRYGVCVCSVYQHACIMSLLGWLC